MTIEQLGHDGLEGVEGAAWLSGHGDHTNLLAARGREHCIVTVT
jgi:hypothetical protein